MKNNDSIFHALQKGGANLLDVLDVNPLFKIGAEPFITKISNYYQNPFPVYSVQSETCGVMRQRVDHFFAMSGLPLNQELSGQDEVAASGLYLEALCNVKLPSARFGVEIKCPGDKNIGLVFEAMKNIGIPYSSDECAGKKIIDCEKIRVHVVTTPETLLPSADIRNERFCLSVGALYFSPKVIDSPESFLSVAIIGSDAFTIKQAPPGIRRVFNSDVFLSDHGDCSGYAATVQPYIVSALHMLWVLAREPKLVIEDTKNFSEENKLRRIRKRPPYSPIRMITIDPDELRRLESVRDKDIVHALTNMGSYKIPGLVLVDGYEKTIGKLVQGYARCADELVRQEATRLLRLDYKNDAGVAQELAELVRSYGNPGTQVRLGQSPLFKICVPS